MLDTALAVQLGMARPTNIRTLIEANREELEAFGSLHAARAVIEAGSAYYLNRPQALLVWIIGADVATGLELANVGCAYKRLAEDERRYIARTSLGLPADKPMVAVSESGFYKLVMRSDKPEARAFQEWVTREVLPAIRKTGGGQLPRRLGNRHALPPLGIVRTTRK